MTVNPVARQSSYSAPVSRAGSRLELKRHRKEIAALLEPEERALLLVDFFVAPGRRHHQSPPEPTPERGGIRRPILGAVALAAILAMGELPFDGPSPSRWLGGISTSGQAGSWAERLLRADRCASKLSTDLLVTDRRVRCGSV